MDEMQRQLRIRAFSDDLRAKVEATRWQVMGIFEPGDPQANLFLYTVGLTQFDQPELLVTDVPSATRGFVNHVINVLAERSIKRALVPGAVEVIRVGDLDFKVRVVEADPRDEQALLGFAIRLYGDRVRALMLDPLMDAEPDSEAEVA